MNNFSVIVDSEEYWISRAIAVVVGCFAKNKEGEWCVLAVQRGIGTPDEEYVGSWCMPCGYLDYNETCVQAAKRELLEETGLTFSTLDFKLISINDNPERDKRQNVTFRYVITSFQLVEELEKGFTDKNSELNEVANIKFIPLNDAQMYNWAFNHETLIQKLFKDREKKIN